MKPLQNQCVEKRRAISRCSIVVVGLVLPGALALPTAEANVDVPSIKCAEIEGADALVKPGAFLIVGEIHGTEEVPQALGDLMCLALKRKLPVTVGLEIWSSEQATIDAVLSEIDEKLAQKTLRESDFFRREYQDGRSSRAMAELTLRIRQLRRSGQDIRISCFDDSGGGNRDKGMADHLADEHRRHADRALLVLTGNAHARKKKNPRFNFTPMGAYLTEAGVEFLSLNAVHAGGTAWICQPSQPCGSLGIAGPDWGATRFIRTEGDSIPDAYDGVLFVGKVTASKPL